MPVSSALDLGPFLDVATDVLLAAMATMGTVGDLVRPGAPGSVDPDTALAAAGTDVMLATGVPMVIIPDRAGSEHRVYPGNPQAPDPRWQVILPPVHVDLRRGDQIPVTASRDPRLVGSRWQLTVLLDNTAGACRMALAHRVPIGGQT